MATSDPKLALETPQICSVLVITVLAYVCTAEKYSTFKCPPNLMTDTHTYKSNSAFDRCSIAVSGEICHIPTKYGII